MTILVRYAIATYKTKGILGLVKKTIRYLNWKQIRGDIMWFVTSAFARQRRLIVMVDGQSMCLHPHDPSLSRELAIYGVHEPTATKLLKGFIHKGMTSVDIGANIGYYALLEANLVGQQGKVLAIEPESRNYELLLYNIELNNIKNIIVAPQCAIGSADSLGKLYLGGSANWHSLSSTSDDTSPYVEVPVRKLDSLLGEMDLPSVDFIRMDIEGYEVEATKGMWHTLDTFKPRLMIELHYDRAGIDGINELLTSLKSLGYHAEYILDRDQDLPSVRRQEVRRNIFIDELITAVPAYRVAMCFLTTEGNQ
jgi:FkbM family methyltransferase